MQIQVLPEYDLQEPVLHDTCPNKLLSADSIMQNLPLYDTRNDVCKPDLRVSGKSHVVNARPQRRGAIYDGQAAPGAHCVKLRVNMRLSRR